MATPRWRLTPLPLRDVAFTRGFLAQRQKVNRQATIYHAYEQLKKTGRLDAFRLKWKPGKENPPHIFWDSDVAKWLEAASYILTTNRSRKLPTAISTSTSQWWSRRSAGRICATGTNSTAPAT